MCRLQSKEIAQDEIGSYKIQNKNVNTKGEEKMKIKKILLIDCKALIILTGTILAFTASALGYNLEEYYPLAQGNRWTYSVIENKKSHEVTVRREGKEIVNGVETVKMSSGEDIYMCLAFDSQGIKIYKNSEEDGYDIMNPPVTIFPNIEIGESKTYSANLIFFNFEGTKIGETSENGQILLESIEDVEVPAGIFTKCLKFSSICHWEDPDGSGIDDRTIWLKQGVGEVRRMCISTEYTAENKSTSTVTEIRGLISAVIDGRKIGQ